MRFADPYALKLQTPRELIIFAACSDQGGAVKQEDYFLNFNDECFALADGLATMPNGEVAAKFVCETAVWGYKLIRQHRFYWADKRLFMRRIFRSANMALWQKRREHEYSEGLATTLIVAMVGAKNYWLGSAGDSGAWHVHGSSIKKLAGDTSPAAYGKRKILGLKRLGLIPDYTVGVLKRDDVLIMASAGCANYLTAQDISTAAANTGTTNEEMRAAAESLVNNARINGSGDNMTAVVIKRIAAHK